MHQQGVRYAEEGTRYFPVGKSFNQPKWLPPGRKITATVSQKDNPANLVHQKRWLKVRCMVSVKVRGNNPHKSQPHHSRVGYKAVYNTVKSLMEDKHAVTAITLCQYKALLLPPGQSPPDPSHYVLCCCIPCADGDVHVLSPWAASEEFPVCFACSVFIWISSEQWTTLTVIDTGEPKHNTNGFPHSNVLETHR